jgi:hypothetical protein
VALPSIGVGGSPLSSAQFVGVKMLGVGAPPRLVVSPVVGCPPLLSSSLEVSKSSRRDIFEEVDGSPGAAIDVNFCFHTLRVSHEGNVKGFLDL